jgi:hypothetical protein
MREVLVAMLLLLAACAPHANVQDMGGGQYSLTATSPSGGYAGAHEEAVEQANDFCSTRRDGAVVNGFYDKSELGTQGEHTSSVIFRCAPHASLHF